MFFQVSAAFALFGAAIAAPYNTEGMGSTIDAAASSTFANMDTSLATPPPRSQPALLPAVHWDHPTWDIRNLAPQSSHDLYYSSRGISDPSLEHMFAKVNTNLTKDVVILDHSSYVRSVTCEQNGIAVSFTNSSGFEFALESWSSASAFMLVTYTDGCGTLANTRSFWEVTGLSFDEGALAIVAKIKEELGIEAVMHSVDMTWGTWNAAAQKQGLPSSWGSSVRDRCSQSSYTDSDGNVAVACHDENFDDNLDRAIRSHARHQKRTLHRRGSKLTSIFKSVAKKLVTIVTENPKEALKAVGKFVSNPVGSIKKVVADIVKFEPSVDAVIPISVAAPPKRIAEGAPWENSVEIYNKTVESKSGAVSGQLAVYCVNCHMTGSIHLGGHAVWNIVDGLKTLTADTDGFFEAQVALGLVASARLEEKFENDLASVTPPPPAGFSVPGVISVGPFVSLSAKAEVELKIKGQVLAGLNMSIPSFKAHLDFLDGSKSSKSGFTPKFVKIFEANAAITATAGLGLPVAIGIGVDVPKLKFKKVAELVDKPSFEAEFKYETGSACKGVDWNIKFANDLYFNAFDAKTFDLFKYQSPALAEGCLSLPGGSGSVSQRSESQDADKRAAMVLHDRDDLDLDMDPTFFTYSETDASDFDKSDEAVFEELANKAEAANDQSSGGYPNGTTFITIKDTTGKYQLLADDSGNLRPGSPSSAGGNTFAQLNGIVYGDDQSRFLHYDNTIMASYGVSRIRLGNPDVAPTDANFVGLVPAETGATKEPYVYGVVDESGSAFVLLTCNYDGNSLPSKLFIAKDGKSGMSTLQQEKLQDSVTGGKVTGCASVGWTVPQNAVDGW